MIIQRNQNLNLKENLFVKKGQKMANLFICFEISNIRALFQKNIVNKSYF